MTTGVGRGAPLGMVDLEEWALGGSSGGACHFPFLNLRGNFMGVKIHRAVPLMICSFSVHMLSFSNYFISKTKQRQKDVSKW